jgi:uncharacterized protein (DUF305 family)
MFCARGISIMKRLQSPVVWGLAIATVGVAAIGGVGIKHLRAQQAATPSPSASEPATSPGGAAQPELCAPMAGGAPMANMHSMRVKSEFEFISHMIPHHQEAIDTAKIILARSQRAEMRQFAQAIITVQTREVGQLQDWLKAWYPNQTSTQAYEPMMRPLENLSGDALDRQFLQDMVHHHYGAVMMAESLLKLSLVPHEPVKTLAKDIIRTQTQEIQQMQTQLTAWFGNEQGMCGRSAASPNSGGMNHNGMNHGGMNHGMSN